MNKPRKPAGKSPASTKLTPKAKASAKAATRSKAFREAAAKADSYANHPERLKKLFEEAAQKAATMPKGPFKESWAYFQAMLRLIRAYYRGEYREVPWHTMTMIIAALAYVVNPFDLIPDAILGIGFLDDATVVGFALKSTKDSVDAFMQWDALQKPIK